MGLAQREVPLLHLINGLGEVGKLTPEDVEHFKRLEKPQWQRDYELKNEEIRRHAYTSLPKEDWNICLEAIEVNEANTVPIERLGKWSPSLAKGIVLFGPVGTGKSTLGKAMINRWASSDFRCLFISVPAAMQRMKDALANSRGGIGIEEEKLLKPHLLILDDLGAEKDSDWTREMIFTIFEKRAAARKFTFFTTNLEPNQILSNYKERIHDRMIQFCSWVKVEGASFRKSQFSNEI